MNRRLLTLLLLVIPLAAVGVAAYVALIRDDDHSGRLSLDLDPAGAPAHASEPRSPETSAPGVPGVSLDSVDAFHIDLRKPPRAGLVFDLSDGTVLWRHNPTTPMPIASLTKIMTALLVVANTHPRDRVRITRAALRYTGSGVGVLPRGRRVRLEALLGGLLIVSGNDAAIALADHISGTERRFVARMNDQARLWGLGCTHYASSHGLEDGDRSCAHDLAVLTRLAMRQPRIRRITRHTEMDYRFPIKGGRLYLTGHNPLQRLGYPGTIGLKTGYTDPAGRCFVGVARRRGHTLGVVLLHSRDPSKQAPKLLDAGFAAESG